MASQKETAPRRIPRRQFVVGAILGATALYAASNPVLRRLGLGLPMPEIGSSEPATVEGILASIKKEYGIEVPILPDQKYQVNTRLLNYQGILNNGLNAQLTLDEAKVLSELVSKIPAAGSLYQLIIPYRYSLNYQDNEGNLRERFAGGTDVGYFWPINRGSSNSESLPDIIYNPDSAKRPDSIFFVTDKAAFELKLPDLPNLNERLPSKKPGDVPLGIFSNIASANVQLNLKEEVPWTTHHERLKQAIAHEFGHGLIDQISVVASCDFSPGCDVAGYYDRLSISLINGETTDWNHPIIKTFAKLNAWQLVPFSKLLESFGADQYSDMLEEAKERERQGKVRYYWARDPEVWGTLENRKPRLTTYASYGPIQETFAEFWMASILYPELLTEKERAYFSKIHQGLKEDSKRFFGEVIQNPQILLQSSPSLGYPRRNQI